MSLSQRLKLQNVAEKSIPTDQEFATVVAPKDLKTQIQRRVVDEITKLGKKTGEKLKDEAIKITTRIMDEEQVVVDQRQKIVEDIMDDAFGYGPISGLLQDDTISEVMVNSYDQIYVESGGKLILSDVRFRDNSHVLQIIERIVAPLGRRIDESSPMVDARLPDGSRINAIIPPLSLKGPCMTIRKFSKEPLTIYSLMDYGTLSSTMADLIRACVVGKLNIVVSGGTGSGKTTTLNVLSAFIPDDERIVTIEDAAELQLSQEHVVTLETRPSNMEGKGVVTIRDLVKNSLRMRPDRIIVGEVRGGEALDMLQAMNTGHDGSLTTAHANSPRDVLSRLETMVLMAGMDLPVRAIREQVASAIDLIIHQSRLRDGSRRITHITEVQGMEGEIITLQDIFKFEQSGKDENDKIMGEFRSTGIRPKFLEKLAAEGIQLDKEIFWPK